MARLLQILALAYLSVVTFFAWGWLAAKLEVFPHSLIAPYYDEIHAFFAQSHKSSLKTMVALDHQEQMLQFERGGLQHRDTTFKEQGYLLLSRYSKSERQAIVELVALDTGAVLHRWRPDLAKIFALAPQFTTGVNTRIAYRSQHPLLLDNGDLLITSGEGPLVRIDSCGKPVWLIDRHFHHSIEPLEDGNFVVPMVLEEGLNEQGITMREDGFAIVSPHGELLATFSVHDLLISNGYQGLVYGVGEFEEDRYHLNDVQPVPDNPREFLLSIRNLSSVARVNIDTGKVIWLQTGPWVNQHDVNPLADGWVSVFGNDLVRGADKLLNDGHSEIYLFHPASGAVKKPFTPVLQALGLHTPYEGRLTLLANGDAFVEETNRDRLVRISSHGLRWQYVNAISDDTSGALHWSRYLDGEPSGIVTPQLLEHLQCDTH